MADPSEPHLTVRTYGLHVRLSASDQTLLDRMTTRLPPTWSASGSAVVDRAYELLRHEERLGGQAYALLADGSPVGHGPHLDPLLDALANDVRAYVAEMAPGRVFVHAGALGWKRRAIIVPGQSWSGKTTLVAELVRAGATYYSDEYAVLDERGFVHPYPQPLSMRGQDGASRKVPAEALGGTMGEEPLPVGLVLLCEYRPGAAWRPESLTAGRGALAIVAHTVSIRRQPAVALAALRHAVARARVLKGERGDARALAQAILHDGAFGGA